MTKKLFMLINIAPERAVPLAHEQAAAFRANGYDVEMVNMRVFHAKRKHGLLFNIISLYNLVCKIRSLARKNPDAVFTSVAYQDGVACCLAGVPCLTVLHSDMRRAEVMFIAWVVYAHMLVFRKGSRMFFLHQTLLDECPPLLWGRDKIGVLENPAPQLPLLRLDYSKKRPLDGIYIGRLQHKQKNLNRLAQLLEIADFPFDRFRIIGDGPDADEIKDRFRLSPINDRYEVEFSGRRKNPWGMIKRPSVLFLATDFEGWPGVIQEAFASGVPVISTCPSPGVRFMLKEGRGLDLAGLGMEEAGARARDFLGNTEAMNSCRRNARAWIDERLQIDYADYIGKTLFAGKL